MKRAMVEIVVPVYDEERALPGCIEVLHEYLTQQFPFPWRITIVDNGSRDRTLEVARRLAATTPGVHAVHLDRKGRGLALRTAWAASDADVVAYMDVDLSTRLDALLPLVAPLLSGHSDIAIGSRLAPGARTVRSVRREVISRGYNVLVRLGHGTPFSDAQCGFKAARRDVIARLLPLVEDDGWFFDTELLLLAHHNRLRIHEVPVDWVEDADSRVRIAGTAWEDVKGLVRVARTKADGRAWAPDLPHRELQGNLLWELVSFAAIGALSTAVHAGLFAALRGWWPAAAANLAALVIATVLNTEANRRLTFVARRGSWLRVQAQGLAVFVLYYAFTTGALLLLPDLVAHPARWLEIAVLLGASAAGTLGRFALLRAWVFARGRDTEKPAARKVAA